MLEGFGVRVRRAWQRAARWARWRAAPGLSGMWGRSAERTRRFTGSRRVRMTFRLALIAALVAFAVLRPVRLLLVRGASMSPAMLPGDVAVVVVGAGVAAGDIACFSDGQSLVCHRVVADSGGGWRTKGDANQQQDWRPAGFGSVLGRVAYVVPTSGLGRMAAQMALGYHRVQARAWP